jgi:hypothetical protein
MTKGFLIAAAAALVLGTAGAAASELPTFEKEGFPMTAHQLQVVGAADVLERSPAPPLGGAPASPHQLALLRPRRE